MGSMLPLAGTGGRPKGPPHGRAPDRGVHSHTLGHTRSCYGRAADGGTAAMYVRTLGDGDSAGIGTCSGGTNTCCGCCSAGGDGASGGGGAAVGGCGSVAGGGAGVAGESSSSNAARMRPSSSSTTAACTCGLVTVWGCRRMAGDFGRLAGGQTRGRPGCAQRRRRRRWGSPDGAVVCSCLCCGARAHAS